MKVIRDDVGSRIVRPGEFSRRRKGPFIQPHAELEAVALSAPSFLVRIWYHYLPTDTPKKPKAGQIQHDPATGEMRISPLGETPAGEHSDLTLRYRDLKSGSKVTINDQLYQVDSASWMQGYLHITTTPRIAAGEAGPYQTTVEGLL